MNESRASLEVIAPSVEEAIEKGLDDLGLPREAVEVEVLDSGSRGLFGIGARQARIRLTIKGSEQPQAAEALPRAERPRRTAPPAESPQPAVSTEPEAPAAVQEWEPEPAAEEPEDEEAEAPAPGEDDEYVLRVARDTVSELLEKMKVRAEVTAHYGEPDDARSRIPLLVDVRGKDLSILIGHKAETLNALQYITSLIVGKELGRSVPLVVDVEGYRARREQQIRLMARRMAEQAVKTGRRQMLEPMPANERRLVHIELRKDPRVTTESIGEDPRRKVTIIPAE